MPEMELLLLLACRAIRTAISTMIPTPNTAPITIPAIAPAENSDEAAVVTSETSETERTAGKVLSEDAAYAANAPDTN